MGSLFSKDKEDNLQQETWIPKEEWKKEVAELKTQFVDETYHEHPIRATTLRVAKEYASSVNATTISTVGVFPGAHKYLGGAYDERDGVIYGIPAHAKSLICLHPTDAHDHDNGDIQYKVRIDPLPKHLQSTKFKWLRGIIAHGYLYGIPAWAHSVLEVDIDAMWGRRPLRPGHDSPIHLIPLPPEHNVQQWQWHGAAMDPHKKAIYAIPSNAQKVLKVDLETHSTSLIDIHVDKNKYPNFVMDMTNKWYGGIPGDDGAVYGMPYRTCAVLRIDTQTDKAKLVGPQHDIQQFNWHGGLKRNGMIYAFPSHANQVLKIDTTLQSKGEHCTLLDIHRAEYDTDPCKNYKWLGGAIGADGNIYSMPADMSSILKINVTNDHCSTFGFVGKESNKWQGGVLAKSDGCIYAIPADGRHVLRMDTRPGQQEQHQASIQLLGDLPSRKDKWQGAFIGKDGNMYAIPEGGYRILKVTPASSNNKDGADQVKIEML